MVFPPFSASWTSSTWESMRNCSESTNGKQLSSKGLSAEKGGVWSLRGHKKLQTHSSCQLVNRVLFDTEVCQLQGLRPGPDPSFHTHTQVAGASLWRSAPHPPPGSRHTNAHSSLQSSFPSEQVTWKGPFLCPKCKPKLWILAAKS